MTAQTVSTTQPWYADPWSRGDRFRKAREHSGLDQEPFGHMIGASRQTVSNYEKDNTTRPVRAIVRAWALATGTTVEWLMEGQDSVSVTSGDAGSISDGDRGTGWFRRHRVVDIGHRMRHRIARRRRPLMLAHEHNHPGLGPRTDPRQHARHLHAVEDLPLGA